MKLKDVKNIFTEQFRWKEVSNGRGNFSVSPDEGSIIRFFYADYKIKQGRRFLLGVFGIYFEPELFFDARGAELSAYVTNFKDYSDPWTIDDEYLAFRWVKLLTDGILRIPIEPRMILADWEKDKLGPYNAHHFAASSPDTERFVGKIHELASASNANL